MHSIRERIPRLFGLLLLMLLAWAHVRMALQLQRAYGNQEVNHPEVTYSRNPGMLSWHARQRYLFGGDLTGATALYRQALDIAPVFIPAWLGLAELYNDTGKRKTADGVMNLVDRYTQNIKRYRWDKILVAYQMQRTDILQRDLTYLIAEGEGQDKNRALRMAFTLWPDPKELERILGDGNLPVLFRYALRTENTDMAIAFWNDYPKVEAALSSKEILSFIQLLMREKRLDLAATIWRQSFNSKALFYNGMFNKKPLQTAFGWQIRTAKGSSWRIEKANLERPHPSLSIRFLHEENLSFSHAAQIVPLAGGHRYLLKGQWQSKELTTDQRPFLEIIGYQCQAQPVPGEMIASSQPWQEFTLPFTVPESCQAIMVRVRRTPSHRIDNLLGGEFRLADLEIVPSKISIAPLVEATR
ncbi:hypothetical protein JWJ90_00115 [Desulfobulbus rhabdoformis]|uniref:tetratricopeptide repeat protein n=1 Tax=Desulfobulbus rhabdoformis TaxID=34032 RepID=UPI00196413A4|nr:tetratricopeptide repeat protein [Desulfobulbus rhabdoformis]MBM9612683.1 hypothetical protein [Desulfobulbus rhabdoformis]